jgi:translation initiation factor 2B subunit (eIF-2B alpha/beta/delta family)
VVTLSYSFTVLCALRGAAARVAHLTVAESRPACEGRRTAGLAASFGIATDLVTDAAAAQALLAADLLLFGADAVYADGSVVNKVGTLPLCYAAERFGTPTLCVTTPSKIMPAGQEPEFEQMDPGELGEPIPGVAVRNPYFEQVSAELVTRIVTGGGGLGADALCASADRLNALQADLGRP